MLAKLAYQIQSGKGSRRCRIHQLFLGIVTGLLVITFVRLLPTVHRNVPEDTSHSVETKMSIQDASVAIAPSTQQRLLENYGKLPLSFEVNYGQTDPSVKFLSRVTGYTLFLTSTEAVFSLEKSTQLL